MLRAVGEFIIILALGSFLSYASFLGLLAEEGSLEFNQKQRVEAVYVR